MGDAMFDPAGSDVSFRTSVLGYDRQEVRAFLANLMEDYERLRMELQRLRDQEPAPPAGTATSNVVAREVQRVLEGAQRVADDLERRAAEEGVQLVAQAQSKAADILADAHRRAAEITDGARREVVALEARAAALLAHGFRLRTAFEAAADAAAAALSDMAARDVTADAPSKEAAGAAV